MNTVAHLNPNQVQVELKKGQTLMVDANLQQPPGALHENVCNRSGLPADTFELYYGSKRLDGEAVLANWGVEKDSLIEVKTRGRGGVHGGGGGGSDLHGDGGVGSCLGDGLGVDGVDVVFRSGSAVGGGDSGLGVVGGGIGASGYAEGGDAGQERKRPQNPEVRPLSPSKAYAEERLLHNSKAAATAPEAEVATAEIDLEAAVPVVPTTEPVSSPNALDLALCGPDPRTAAFRLPIPF